MGGRSHKRHWEFEAPPVLKGFNKLLQCFFMSIECNILRGLIKPPPKEQEGLTQADKHRLFDKFHCSYVVETMN